MIFGRVAQRISNTTPPLSAMGQYMLQRVEEGFALEQDPHGRKWATLDPAYKRRKKGPSILTESFKLRDSFAFNIRGRNVQLGPGRGIPYDRIHQKGGVAGFGAQIPQRTYVDVTEKDVTRFQQILINHFAS